MDSDVSNLRDLGMRTSHTLQKYLTDTQGWMSARRTNDVIIEYKHSECPGFEHGYLYRGQSSFPCKPETVFHYIHGYEGDMCLRAKWDKDMSSVTLLRQVEDDLSISLTRTNRAARGLISPREFVDLVLVVRTDTCLSMNSTGIDLQEYPPTNSTYVRGFNYPSGFICLQVPSQPDKTQLVTFVQSDIKGLLPKTLIHSALPGSMIGSLDGLRDILRRDGHLRDSRRRNGYLEMNRTQDGQIETGETL